MIAQRSAIRYQAVRVDGAALVPCALVLHEERIKEYQQHGHIIPVIEAVRGPVQNVIEQPLRIFRSLNRPSAPHKRKVQSGDFLAYVGRPDYSYTYDPVQRVEQRAYPPAGRIFVVWVAPNKDYLSQYPGVFGWIDHWNWVESDPDDELSPIHFRTRYEEQLWPLPTL